MTRQNAIGQIELSYEGELLHDVPHGKGVEICSNGWRYDGMYQQGKKGPRGVETRTDGCVYEGDFKDDKFHGHGKLSNPASQSVY